MNSNDLEATEGVFFAILATSVNFRSSPGCGRKAIFDLYVAVPRKACELIVKVTLRCAGTACLSKDWTARHIPKCTKSCPTKQI